MHRFAGAFPTELGRKAFWIVVAALVAMLTLASAVFSQPYLDQYYDYGDGGMPRPDGIRVQTAPAPGVLPPGHARVITYTYNATSRPDGSILITRNGVKWVTLANKNHQFLLSDPNGTGHVVVKMFGFPTRSGGAPQPPVKVRAQVR